MVDADIVDDIYDAAFFPDRWPDVLDRLAEIVGARGGVMFTANRAIGVLRHVASMALCEDVACYARDGWLFRGSRLTRLTAHNRAGFVVEQDLFSEDDLAADATYRDFLRPRGLGWAAGTLVALPTEDIVVFSLERDYAAGPVEPAAVARLDDLRPHLARSSLVAARLQLARAEAAAATLDLLDLPALVLDDLGRVIVANSPAATLGETIQWRARDQVALNDAIADIQLRAALAGLALADRCVCSFVVRGQPGHPAMIAHLLPLRRDARDLFAGAAAVLVITPITTPAAPPVELYQVPWGRTQRRDSQSGHDLIQHRWLWEVCDGVSGCFAGRFRRSWSSKAGAFERGGEPGSPVAGVGGDIRWWCAARGRRCRRRGLADGSGLGAALQRQRASGLARRQGAWPASSARS